MLFATLDWRTHELYDYLAIGGGALVVLSLALYLVPMTGLKLLARLISLVGGLSLGLGLGVIGMGAWGYQLETPPYAYPNGMPANMGGPPGQGGLGVVMVQFPGAAPLRPPGTSNSKPQLVALVAKLDALTDKPLTIELSEGQRKEIREQLRGLADVDNLSEEDATARVAALREALTEDQRDALQAAGFRWSAQGGGGGGLPPGLAPPQANPFRTEQNSKHLNALTSRVAKDDKK
jgi:hypothetical protein